MMNKHLKDIEDRWLVYSKYKHVPSVKVSEYSFDEIEVAFDNKKSVDCFNTRVRISYEKYFPQISNCVILNCANSDAVNAGYRINHCITKKVNCFMIVMFLPEILTTSILLNSTMNYCMPKM